MTGHHKETLEEFIKRLNGRWIWADTIHGKLAKARTDTNKGERK